MNVLLNHYDTLISNPIPKELEVDWALKVTKYQRRIYSQGGQDGTLMYILKHIGATNKKYVEFGFSSNDMTSGTGPNTRLLWESRAYGWEGLLLDSFYENPEINLHKVWITPDTIVHELRSRGVENGTDYISIDMDSADCFVAERVACELQPRILSVEYNSNYPLEATIANIGEGYKWNNDRLYGCGLGVHYLIAEKCGYSIVDVVRRLDVFMVRNDVLYKTPTVTYSIEHWRPFTRQTMHFAGRRDEEELYLCDYKIYMETRNLDTCMGNRVTEQLERLEFDLHRQWLGLDLFFY